MRRTLFGRLFLSHFLVALAALVVGGGFLAALVVRSSLDTLGREFGARTALVADLLAEMDAEQLDRFRAGPRPAPAGAGGATLQVLDPDGLARLWAAVQGSGHPGAWRGARLDRVLDGRTANGVAAGPGGTRLISAAPLWHDGEVVGAVVIESPLDPGETGRALPLLVLLYSGLAAAAVGLLLSWRVSRSIALPVARASAAARRLSAGDLGSRVDWRSGDELGELADSFNRMAAELQRLEQARRDLVANASHELKGPVARVQLALSMLQEGIGGPEQQGRLLDTALQETERLGGLVADLLEFSRLQAGRLEIHPAAADLGGLLRRVLDGFQPQARQQGIVLEGRWGALPTVECDLKRVEQIVGNLLENAVKFTPAGGRVELAAAARGDAVEVAVSDTGPGIPPGEQDRIWERFYKADPARTPVAGAGRGAGLGLAVARQLVQLHGGQVSVSAAPGGGARLAFTLPLRSPAAQE